MAQSEQSTIESNNARQARAARERDIAPTQHSGMLVGVACALVVAGSAWFFYHQGQRDALRPVAIPTAAASNETASPTEPVRPIADDAAATTMVQTPSYGQPDIIVTAHPSQDQAASAADPKPAMPARVKAARPAKTRTMIAATMPLEREVTLASRPPPAYPPQALRAHDQGTVLVLAQVDVNGQVSDARVVRHSGSNILDRAAPNEVRRWKFQPALHEGRPIVANVEVPVSYRLDQ